MVITRIGKVVLLACLMLSGAMGAWTPAGAAPQTRASKSAETLYLQLRNIGLDKSRVYRVRGASLDRSALHLTLEDGTIAFTQDVFGRITGAFFEGDGEVLLASQDKAERSSMALFTGMAILEEQFGTAYFRFNDDTYAELQPWLRPSDHAQEFVSQWDETARNLADFDALRLLMSIDHFLPPRGRGETKLAETQSGTDRMLHARVQGRKLGTFDVCFDSEVPEPLWAGHMRTVEGASYYDVWASFAPNRPDSQVGKEVQDKREDVTITRYTIRSDMKPPTDLNGDARLQLEARRGGERALLFELSRFLQIKTVEANGRPVEFIHNQALEGSQLARRGNDLVAVVFPERLKTGEKLELRFRYGGEVLSEAGGGLLYVGARGTWYPNRGIAMSDFDLEFHYPPGWTLLATGKRVPVPSQANPASDGGGLTMPGEQVTRWVSERPIPIAGFNLGKYVRAVTRAGDVTVESYATAGLERNFPKSQGEVVTVPDLRKPAPFREQAVVITPPAPSPARNAQPVADQSAREVEFFARRFGPFPYSSLEITQMPGKSSQGWPGLVFLSSYAFLTPEQKRQVHLDRLETLFSGLALAHETAHQWWGDLITWRSYHDQWIVEGLANYCAMMVLESESPAEFRIVMEKYRQDLLQKNKSGELLKDAGPVTLGLRLSSSHFPGGYEAISYGRGTWLFHMLRYMLLDAEAKGGPRPRGSAREDEPFVRCLRKLRDRYEGKVITTRDLLRVFEEDLPPPLQFEGKKNLNWFLEGWVNGTALPHFEAHGVKFAPKGDATIVSGTLLQKDAPEELVTAVPVYAAVAGKTSVLLGRVFVDGPESTFRLTAPSGTRKILIDPYQTLLTSSR